MESTVQIRKQKALDFFLDELLKTEARDSIAKVILFGSLLKGEAKEESDIDLLVVALDSPRKVSNACADAAFEAALANGESVEPLVRCIDEARYPRSYFVYSTLKRGREVYSMNSQELKRRESRNYLALGEEYLDGSRDALQRGFFRIAVDAGYNACELAIKGLLLSRLSDLPGSYGGIVNKFGDIYVRSGELPKELGRQIRLALEKRNNARYEPHAQITKEEAEDMVALGEKLRLVLEHKTGGTLITRQ